jgi:hypothetical protein
LLTGVSLTACSTTGAIDLLPAAAGGLPADAPPRPAEQPRFLPVNAWPGPRDTPPLTADEQKKLEDELSAVRDRQAASVAAANGEPAKPAPGSPSGPEKKAGAKPPEKKKPTQESSN